MKYYISKPKTHKLDEQLVSGIKETDTEAVFVDEVGKSDICVFQKGWSRSKQCIADYKASFFFGVKRMESYLYTDKISVKFNHLAR